MIVFYQTALSKSSARHGTIDRGLELTAAGERGLASAPAIHLEAYT
jgi:hypothetical protein